jgi:hypothetical protein
MSGEGGFSGFLINGEEFFVELLRRIVDYFFGIRMFWGYLVQEDFISE